MSFVRDARSPIPMPPARVIERPRFISYLLNRPPCQRHGIIQRRVGPLSGPAGLPWYTTSKYPTLKAVESVLSHFHQWWRAQLMVTSVKSQLLVPQIRENLCNSCHAEFPQNP